VKPAPVHRARVGGDQPGFQRTGVNKLKRRPSVGDELRIFQHAPGAAATSARPAATSAFAEPVSIAGSQPMSGAANPDSSSSSKALRVCRRCSARWALARIRASRTGTCSAGGAGIHHILDETYVVKNLQIVNAISLVPKNVKSALHRINDVRNDLAHSFFPEMRRRYAKVKKVVYSEISLFTKAGAEKFEEDFDTVYNYLHARWVGSWPARSRCNWQHT
jgi:hypothetical protein